MCVVSNMCMSSSKIQHSHSVCDEGSSNLGRCIDDDICVTCLHQRQSRKHFFGSSFHHQMNKNKAKGTWMDIGALSIRTKHMIGIQHVTSIFSFTWTYPLFSPILFLGFGYLAQLYPLVQELVEVQNERIFVGLCNNLGAQQNSSQCSKSFYQELVEVQNEKIFVGLCNNLGACTIKLKFMFRKLLWTFFLQCE